MVSVEDSRTFHMKNDRKHNPLYRESRYMAVEEIDTYNIDNKKLQLTGAKQ